MMDKAWNDVRDFHVAFGAPSADSPVLLSDEQAKKRAKWMREEIDELLEAQSIEEQADAMIDLIYFALGTLVEMGVRPAALFDIVHKANMQKLGPDGKPLYKEDNKVRKPDGWQDPAPLLRTEIQRQTEA